MHPSPDVLALLALGEEAGTPEDRAHVPTCPACRAEIADLSRAVAAGREGRTGDSGLVTPPERVWQGIRAELGLPAAGSADRAEGARGLAEVAPATELPRRATAETNGAAPDRPDAEPPVPPATVTPISAAPSRSSRGRRGLAALVAAVVALVLGIGLGLGMDRILGPRQTVLWTANLQAAGPDFAGSNGEAVVEQDGEGNRTLVIDLDSPEPVDGSRGVWLIDQDDTQQMRLLGFINGDRGAWPVPRDLDPRQFAIVDVSKEPPGDPDLRHSGTSIVRGTLDV